METEPFSIDPLTIKRCRAICPQQSKGVEKLSSYLSVGVELSVYRCRAIYPALMNSFSSLISWSNLYGFNTRLEQHVS